MRWGRFGVFLVTVLVIFGLTAGTSMKLWKTIPLGLDLKGGFDLLYEVQPDVTGKAPTASGIQAALEAVTTRVNSLGVASPNIDLESGNEIRVDLAGAKNFAQANQVIGQTAQLGIYGGIIQTKKGIEPDPKKYLVGGNDIESNAQANQNPTTGAWEVDITFKNAQKWATITQQYTGKPIYTFLNGNLINSATVDEMIAGGQTSISGLGTQQACQQLASQLNAGALPYPLKLISSDYVGPSLGTASLNETLYAGGIAIILIFIFMLIMYRVAGLVADISLIAYAYLTLVVFSGLHIVLTLPGLAALVLGIGMAVDANIITYERVKDEIRNGRSLQSAVITGNKRALRTILDSNATTFIAAVVMFWFGTGDIRGFAIALMVSIIVSLLTAVLVGRFMFISLTRSNLIKRPMWYGIRKGAAKR